MNRGFLDLIPTHSDSQRTGRHSDCFTDWLGGQSAGPGGSASQHSLFVRSAGYDIGSHQPSASPTAIQIRAYTWSQKDGDDQLAATDAVVVSPPLASIPAGATQVVRLILRQAPQGSEVTYRILIDQIPPPAEPGIVHVVLRLSIPIFAQPMSRALAHLQFHIEDDAGQPYLVAINDGLRHEVVRDIALSTSDGRKLKADPGTSPYVLAGASRRWHITAQDSQPLSGAPLRLTAHGDAGAIEQQVPVVVKP